MQDITATASDGWRRVAVRDITRDWSSGSTTFLGDHNVAMAAGLHRRRINCA